MSRDWRRLLVEDIDMADAPVFHPLTAPIVRGTTTVFDSVRDAAEHWDLRSHPYAYGIHGTPTAAELRTRLARLEGSFGTFIVPSGQAATLAVCMAMLNAGDHVLLPDSAYGPAKALFAEVISRFGVTYDYYPPLAGKQIEQHFRDNTRLIWCESPGSVTMEVQDIPAIVAAAHGRGIKVALDNSYAAGVLFDAFSHGVDLSIQALTKYVNGHSDVFMGALSVADAELYEQVGATLARLGMAVSPDDCALVLRGMQTLAIRLDAVERSAIKVAHWLADRREVKNVLHPALPDCPGHDLWLRDFSGSSGVFSFVPDDAISDEALLAFVDALRLFKIGYSWGGVTSLAMPYLAPRRAFPSSAHRVIRLHVGLEPVKALLEDLEQAFAILPPFVPKSPGDHDANAVERR